MTMSLARIWGFDDSSLAYSEKIRIASSAARQIAYDCGYQKEPVATTVMKWVVVLLNMRRDHHCCVAQLVSFRD